MDIVCKVSEKTYTNKAGNDSHYVNYYIRTDNGLWIQIRPSFAKDIPALKAIAVRL